jgi:hypothetical protein
VGGRGSQILGDRRRSRNPHLVYVPSREIWDKNMPPWAHSRRDEIVGLIKQQLGVAKYEFRELEVTDA